MDRRIFYEITGRQLREGEFSYAINGDEEKEQNDWGGRLVTDPEWQFLRGYQERDKKSLESVLL